VREKNFGGEVLVNVKRDPRIRLQAVPEDVVVGELALLGNLRRLGLQLLQAENVRPLLLDPFAELRRAGADPVDVPGGNLQGEARSFTSP